MYRLHFPCTVNPVTIQCDITRRYLKEINILRSQNRINAFAKFSGPVGCKVNRFLLVTGFRSVARRVASPSDDVSVQSGAGCAAPKDALLKNRPSTIAITVRPFILH